MLDADALMIDDRYERLITAPDVATVDDACRRFFEQTPGWLVKLMKVRNRLVRRLGFTAGPDEPPVVPERFSVGDELSVFTVVERTEDEIIFGADDQHFSLRLSIEVIGMPAQRVAVTTNATAHDRLGRAYLTVVKFPHRPIAARMTKIVAGG